MHFVGMEAAKVDLSKCTDMEYRIWSLSSCILVLCGGLFLSYGPSLPFWVDSVCSVTVYIGSM